MSAPTPGPWTLREPVKATGDERMDWGISASIDGEPSLIAECFWRVGVRRYAPCHANARLIAAAPRMLELLEEIAAFRAMAEQEHDPIMLRLTGEAIRIIKGATNG